MAANDRLLKPTDQVYDLVDEVAALTPKLNKVQGYNRILQPKDKVYDLCDVFEEGRGPSLGDQGTMAEEVRQIALATVERIARELIPDIAERVIREEIEKLKTAQNDDEAYGS